MAFAAVAERTEPVLKTQAERWWAALAHAAVLLLGFGTALPALVWMQQRKSARVVAQQALQALVWQSLLPVFYQLLLLIWGLAVVGLSFLGNVRAMVSGLLWGLALLLGLGSVFYLGVGVLAAVVCLMGRPFCYPFFGRALTLALAKDLPGDDLAETEERVSAAMAHAGILMPLIGMAVPLCTLVAARQGSRRLRFQSWQALAVQGIANVLNLVLPVLASFPLALIAVVALTLSSSQPVDLPSGLMQGLLLLSLILLALCFVVALLLPLLAVFAFIASIQVLRGREYVYPLLGGWIRRRLGDSFVERPV